MSQENVETIARLYDEFLAKPERLASPEQFAFFDPAVVLHMSLPSRRAGTSLFGKTLETILAERPCRVIIQSSPGLGKQDNVA